MAGPLRVARARAAAQELMTDGAEGSAGRVTLEPIDGDWRLYNDLVVEALRGMSIEELALRAPSGAGTSSTSWPTRAIAGHAAARGTR